MRCLCKSERFERILDLTVEINGDVGTLEQALAHFTATEILDGENKYFCNRFIPHFFLRNDLSCNSIMLFK